MVRPRCCWNGRLLELWVLSCSARGDDLDRFIPGGAESVRSWRVRWGREADETLKVIGEVLNGFVVDLWRDLDVPGNSGDVDKRVNTGEAGRSKTGAPGLSLTSSPSRVGESLRILSAPVIGVSAARDLSLLLVSSRVGSSGLAQESSDEAVDDAC